jgi:nicotinamide riboside kinase
MRPPEHVRLLALLGGESSGKTSLARALAGALHTAWVPEYGRELWEQLRRTLDAAELVAVARRQVALEEEARAQAAPRQAGWLVCDTTPLTTLQYSLHDHGSAPAELVALAERRYDLAVVCEPDFEFVQDGCRRDDVFRAAQHDWALARLAEMRQPHIRARGPLRQRVAQVLQRIDELHEPTR